MDWLMWAVAGVIALYLTAVLVFKNPFKEPLPDFTPEPLNPTNHLD
jgi:hypothetical protein